MSTIKDAKNVINITLGKKKDFVEGMVRFKEVFNFGYINFQ